MAPTGNGVAWTREEDIKLARAFIDLDLDGEDLHTWCHENGITRSAGAIDRRVRDQNYFMPRDPKEEVVEKILYRSSKFALAEAKRLHEINQAKRNLREQVLLAKAETREGVPKFKPGPLTWSQTAEDS